MAEFDATAAGEGTGRPVRGHSGMAEVRHVESATKELRALDHRFGGGACREAVLALSSWSERVLTHSSTTRAVRDRLGSAMADLHNLAAWTCFDSAEQDLARIHVDRASELAALVGNHDLAANVLYRSGRMHLHRDDFAEALTAFRLGEVSARRAESDLGVAILCVNQAWTHARMGDRDQALTRMGWARDAFEAADRDATPTWSAFFDETDLGAMTGIVYTELARTVDLAYTAFAIPPLTSAIATYSEGMTRSRALSQIALTVNHVLEHDFDHAAKVGLQAVDSSAKVTSTRTRDRMRPLRDAAARYEDEDARELVHRIDQFTASA
ncbi:tol-pal system YbgF family protein [Umezawaea endophytica]|uniref:Transcriptional regulator n=1 Tax=Umezawaea endophytica TaxID=1654476 RepID=A0A9X2VJM2_9PSEU|nr:transcriptional regulator [Umezawaea endophytica]MCS7477292.1 transcriptional regulator [Umezawaea endophytica]